VVPKKILFIFESCIKINVLIIVTATFLHKHRPWPWDLSLWRLKYLFTSFRSSIWISLHSDHVFKSSTNSSEEKLFGRWHIQPFDRLKDGTDSQYSWHLDTILPLLQWKTEWEAWHTSVLLASKTDLSLRIFDISSNKL